jgi:SNF2 family DNA or RNA helicase
MLTPEQLHDYQKRAVNFQSTRPSSALWLDMGLGKTAVTLTSIQHLLDTGFLRGVLVVAPIRVVRLVWRQEALKWQHTKGLTFSTVAGTKDQRIRALMRKADVYLINYENLRWLASVLKTYYIRQEKPFPFDGLVWDELSKMKNSGTERVKAFRHLLPHFKWKTGLTGTPASNGYKDLHGQFLVLDEGYRLGTNKGAFTSRFFYSRGFKQIPFDDTPEIIHNLISDITLEMSAADYNPLPDMVVNNVEVQFDKKLRAQYEALERDFFFQLDNGVGIEVFNRASLTNKCLQFSNGNIYPVPGLPMWERVHDLKLEALEDILEEAAGKPVLCSYAYRSDAERIMERFKKLRPINLTDCKTEQALSSAMARWKAGDCALMIGHPASMGHGVDGLQDAGNILVWYGLNWSLDLYDQFNARIRRQGQGMPVICHRIIVPETLDEAQVMALDEKSTTEKALRKAVSEYRAKKNPG